MTTDRLESSALGSATGPARVGIAHQRRSSEGTPSSRERTRRARLTYARVLLLGDAVVLAVVLAIAQFTRFGIDRTVEANVVIPMSYAGLGAVIAMIWWVALQVSGSRDPRLVGHGAEEYRRVIKATFVAFGVMAMLALLVEMIASRGYLAVAFPLGLAGLLIWRRAARAHLHRRRTAGKQLANVLVVGTAESARRVSSWFATNSAAGYRVTGVWSPRLDRVDAGWLEMGGGFLPVMSNGRSLGEAARIAGAETVLVSDTEHLGHDGLKELTWQLDDLGLDLMLSPNVLDVAQSRLYLHDLSGMPLLHVDAPQYAGATKFAKAFFDRLGALAVLVALSPVFLTTALLVKLSSAGPVFYRQTRIGRDGRPFEMIKFRSMRLGADAELQALLASEGKAMGELPKLQRDPRVTRVGGVIRRYSIDELPQLVNVLKGDMSLVGPRPQRDFEVEQYDQVASRRLRVRPGMTGLWQVSGRSDLSYDEAIRLDVHYVENWSTISDVIILWKTVRAVFGSDGAY